MYSIETPDRFLRQAHHFFKQHPDLKERFTRLIDELIKNPFQPRLKLHALGGKLFGCHAVGLTHKYRIIITLVLTENNIILLDIGSHDQVYRSPG